MTVDTTRSPRAGEADGKDYHFVSQEKFKDLISQAAFIEHAQFSGNFYGTSFIADERGDIIVELGREEEGVITATFDLDRVKRHRAAFGFFRDRRPELYGRLVQDI